MSSIRNLLLIASASLAVTTPALAEDSPQPAIADIAVSETGSLIPAAVDVSVAAAPIAASDEFAALSDSELTELRGGETLLLSNQTLVAITTGNVITGNYTAGNVSLSDHALSSFNGVGNLLINTGGQVSLQSGMNLTINVGE